MRLQPFRSRAVIALIAGGLLPLSLAPFDLWWFALASLALLLALLEGARFKEALYLGWLFGIGMFGVGSSWIYHSIHEYGYAPPYLAAFLTGLFVLCIAALMICPISALYQRFFSGRIGAPLLAFPALWVLAEWMRSWLFTGFPWLYIGNAHLDTWLAPWAPILGVYGIGWIIATSAAAVYLFVKLLLAGDRTKALLPLLLPLSFWGVGASLISHSWTDAERDSLQVSLLQPNISQHVKWRPEQQSKTLALLEAESNALMTSDLIIWPENAIPLFYHQATPYLNRVSALGAANGTAFISGIPYWQPGATRETPILHNSVIAFGQGAEGLYHKQKLVPFGEYVPLQNWLRGVIAFFDLPMSNFAVGPKNQKPLLLKRAAGDLHISPFICYEIVYPDFVRRMAQNSDLLLTISDDSWFGTSIGPIQHLQMARMRALENNRYLVRATNTGISAIIDNRGQITQAAESFVTTQITGQVTLILGRTPFSHWGSTPLVISCMLILGIVSQRRKPCDQKN